MYDLPRAYSRMRRRKMSARCRSLRLYLQVGWTSEGQQTEHESIHKRQGRHGFASQH